MAQNTIITSSRIEAIQGWALPSRWSWSGIASGKSTSNLVSSLLLLAIQCMMWWQAWVPFFFLEQGFVDVSPIGPLLTYSTCCLFSQLVVELGILKFLREWFLLLSTKFESNSVKKNLRDLILVAFFGHPTKLHDSEGPCGRVAVIRPWHRDFVGTLELAAKVPLET